MFFSLCGYWERGGGVSTLVHNVLMKYFILCSSKIEVSETFFLIFWSPKMTIQGM